MCDAESHHFITFCYRSNFNNRKSSMKGENRSESFPLLALRNLGKETQSTHIHTAQAQDFSSKPAQFLKLHSAYVRPFWGNSL